MKLVQIPDIATFVAIVEHGSLSAAANALGVKPPAISYRLSRLEGQIGTPLLLRTTRQAELTEAGRRLYERSKPALHALVDAVSDAQGASDIPKGTLRLALSHIAFRYTLADHLAEFRSRYPEILLDLSFDDEIVDLVGGEFHAGVRVGDLLDEKMIAVKLTGTRRIVHVAAPEYLNRMGRPQTPADLLHHDCILYRFGRSARALKWEFKGDDGPVSLEINGGVRVNNTSAQIDATRLGLGIAWFGEKIVERDIQEGRLEVVLKDYAIERPPFYLYYPTEYRELRILRVLVDFLNSRKSS